MPENLEVDEKVTTFAHVNETSRDGAEVARWAHNPKVGSSSLPPATKHKINTLHLAKYLFFLYGYKENIRFIKEKYKM